MPKKYAIVVPMLFAQALLLTAETRRVDVVAQVPLVTQVECPAVIDLVPGEARSVTVRVACNQSWLLAIEPDNRFVRSMSRRAGSAGGMAASGHCFTLMLTCAPDAVGPQRAMLTTRLVVGPLVTSLSH